MDLHEREEMKNAAILKLIRTRHPKNEKELRTLGLKPRLIGEGCSRRAVLLGKRLVFKFLIRKDEYNLDHANAEHAGFQRLGRSKYRHLLPKIYYFNPATGVIVMRYYKNCSDLSYENKQMLKARKQLESLFKIGNDGHDWGYDNFGRTPAKRFKIIDLGISS
jgi:hypothetical protein